MSGCFPDSWSTRSDKMPLSLPDSCWTLSPDNVCTAVQMLDADQQNDAHLIHGACWALLAPFLEKRIFVWANRVSPDTCQVMNNDVSFYRNLEGNRKSGGSSDDTYNSIPPDG